MLGTLTLAATVTAVMARDIVFPAVVPSANQYSMGAMDPGVAPGLSMDISKAKFAGLTTYANLPYVHCLAAEEEEVEAYDIAILGAPFDTVSYALLLELVCGLFRK